MMCQPNIVSMKFLGKYRVGCQCFSCGDVNKGSKKIKRSFKRGYKFKEKIRIEKDVNSE